MRPAWFVLLSSSTFVACTSFGDAPATVAHDGGASSSSSSSSSGGTSADAGPDGAAVGSGFCSTVTPAPTFCLDFEDGLIPSTNLWETVTSAGSLAVKDCGPGTSKQCLELVATHPGAGSPGTALRYDLAGSRRSTKVALSLRVAEITGGAWDVVGIGIKGETGPWVLEIEIDPQRKLWLAEFEFGQTNDITEAVPTSSILGLEQWARLELEMNIEPTQSSATVRVDGKIVGTKPLRAHLGTALERIEIGDGALDANVSAKVRIDDVVATVSP